MFENQFFENKNQALTSVQLAKNTLAGLQKNKIEKMLRRRY